MENSRKRRSSKPAISAMPLRSWLPLDPETAAQLVAQVGLVDVGGGFGVRVVLLGCWERSGETSSWLLASCPLVFANCGGALLFAMTT